MTVWEARFQHIVNLLVALTGIGYAYFKYFGHAADPFSAVGSPFVPAFRDAHVLVVPALLFACGLIWRSHVLKNLNAPKKPKRASGIGLLCVLVPMAATGYLIQTAVDETWRKAFVWVHLVTSAVWVSSYLSHSLVPVIKEKAISRRTRRRAIFAGMALSILLLG